MTRKRTKAGTSKQARAEKERLFVEAMIQNGGNATQAAVAAGYTPGAAAEKAGYRLSKDVRVAGLLAVRRAQVLTGAMEKTQLTAEEVLLSLARDIRFDPAKLYKPDGTMKAIHELDEDTRLALRGIEFTEIMAKGQVDEALEGQPHGGALKRSKGGKVAGHVVKVKFPEKTAAREQGMKHFGLYELDNKQKPSPTVNVGVLTVQPQALNFEKVRARALKAA